MKLGKFFVATAIIVCTNCLAQGTSDMECKVDRTYNAFGGQVLQQVRCAPPREKTACEKIPEFLPICEFNVGGRTVQQLRLNGKEIVFATTTSRANFDWAYGNMPEDVFVFMVVDDDKLACVSRLLLVDLRPPAPKAFEFGIGFRCSDPSQAFWSTKKGVEKGTLIVKPDVKFVYTKGKLIPPDDEAAADPVAYTSEDRLEEASRAGYPGAYVKEIPLISAPSEPAKNYP